MCRDQNLISETDGRTDVRTYVRTDVRAKIEKRGVGRPLLGPAKIQMEDKLNNSLNDTSQKFTNFPCTGRQEHTTEKRYTEKMKLSQTVVKVNI